jgi:NAD(P)-dependent dehydrogenase (short-subunit alcohol dehydrogenase family)
VVTGANRGIGFETALALARHRASVVMAVRSLSVGEAAAVRIRREIPGSSVGARLLDLADLGSVRRFATQYLEAHRGLDGLINSAGVMLAPNRRTKDGFELHWGTNHLGHFALTALLLPALTAAPDGRVVTMTSLVASRAAIHFGDEGGRRYSRQRAYATSKLANLVFALELARRLDSGGSPVRSMAVHPGYTNTGLMSVSLSEDHRRLARLTGAPGKWIAQPAAMGAWPSLFAAGAREAVNGGIYAPGLLGVRGHPRAIRPFRSARSRELAERLWVESEHATSLVFPLALAPH